MHISFEKTPGGYRQCAAFALSAMVELQIYLRSPHAPPDKERAVDRRSKTLTDARAENMPPHPCETECVWQRFDVVSVSCRHASSLSRTATGAGT